MAALTVTDSIAPSIAPSPTRRRRKSLSEEAIKRVPNKPNPSKLKESDKPSEKMKARQKAAAEDRTLGEALAEVAAMTPEGDGPLSRGLKTAVSGAAAGATLGEFLAKAAAKRGQEGRGKRKARTLSEKARES